MLKTNTAKSKKTFIQIFKITDAKQNTKKKILVTNKNPQKLGKSNKNKLFIEYNNLELKKSCIKRKQKKNQK